MNHCKLHPTDRVFSFGSRVLRTLSLSSMPRRAAPFLLGLVSVLVFAFFAFVPVVLVLCSISHLSCNIRFDVNLSSLDWRYRLSQYSRLDRETMKFTVDEARERERDRKRNERRRIRVRRKDHRAFSKHTFVHGVTPHAATISQRERNANLVPSSVNERVRVVATRDAS